jgi:tetratricopeptide (TPR) repeat protein
VDDATAARIQYASLLLARYTAEGNVSDLVHAGTLWEKALPGLDGDPALPACLTKYASVLYERFNVTREAGLLQLAVSRQEEALALAAAHDPDLCLMQVSLAVMLSGHLTGSEGSGKLDRAVALVLAAESAATRHDSRLMLAVYMASVLLSQQGADAHLGTVERMTSAALRDAPPSAPEYAKLHLLLGRALHRRYARHGAPADLDAVLTTATCALHAAPPRGPVRVDALQLLAVGRQLRWRRSGAVADLTAAIELRREAGESGPSPEMLPDLYTGLCSALRDRFERHGDLADLNAALAAGRAALHACAHRPASRARCLANLSSAYRTRFERARKPRDLARAVRMARTAVEQAAPGDQDRPRLLGTLTLALLRDFGYNRRPGRADEAIEVSRSAAAVTPPGHPLRPLLLGNTANALRARYEWTGDLADLNEAVALADEAVEITSPGDPARPRRQAALGTALLRRFESTGRRPDADRAVQILTAAGAASPEDHPERPGLQANLAIVLFRRFETNGDPADLQACLKAGLDAVRATPDDDFDRFRRLSQLAAPLRARYLTTGAEPDLEAAIAAARSAARALDDGDSHFNLAMALRLRHERDQLASTVQSAGPVHLADAGDDRAAAEASFARCARSAATAPLIRAAAAAYCAQLNAEVGDWAAADAAYAQALELLPMLTGRQFGWDSRHRQLARLASLGTDAAAVAVRLGDRQRAVLILEQARGILIGQALEQHRDVMELHRVAPGLAAEFSRLAALLAADTAASSEFDADPAALADPAAARRETVARWDDLIATIRRMVPGHQRFLAAPQYGDLLTAAADGPVVIVNVSRYRCDALIVRPAGIELCPLPGLTSAEATRQAERFLAATAAGGDPAEALPQVLDWLWTALSAPVLRALGPARARLWWMPTGPLTVLPLHAAAWRDPASPDRPSPAVLDLVISSYTPTLRTLIDARSVGLAPPGDDALVVAMTQTAGAAPLPRAAAEAAAVAPLLGGQVTTLTDHSATPAAVRAALRQATRAHLACHAVADLADPASGALLLSGGRLTVRDIAALPWADRQLAYLSACTTALSEGLLADEGMHVASGFQLAGFAHVIGTLWRIDDDTAPTLAQDFYHSLSHGHPPVVALHDAVRALRQRYPQSPALWGAYVHIGP